MALFSQFSPHNEVAVLPLRHEVMARVPPSQDESHLKKEGEVFRHISQFSASRVATDLWFGVLSRALLIKVAKLRMLAVLDGVPPVIPAVGSFLEVIAQNVKVLDLFQFVMEHSSITGISFKGAGGS